MKPYYEEKGITIYHGDCREILPQLGRFDLLLTDPPYSISSAENFQRIKNKGTRVLDFFEGDQDWDAMTKKVIERISLCMGKCCAAYIWCGHRQFGQLVDLFENASWKTRFLVWRKKCPIPAPPGVGYDSSAELCVYAFRDGRKWTPATGDKMPNVVDADSYRFGQPGKVDHPTQKPISVIAIPMLNSTDSGDSVLDPFMGSGTTLVVAKANGREATGIELEERYCEIAANRLRQEVFSFEVPA